MPVLSLPLHHLSKVMSFPPPEAYNVLLLTAELAHDHREDGLSYGPGQERVGLDARLEVDLDEQAPPDLRGDADATWGTEGGDRIGYLATRCCAAVAHGIKSIRVICDAVHESENYASTQLAQARAPAEHRARHQRRLDAADDPRHGLQLQPRRRQAAGGGVALAPLAAPLG